MAQERSGRGRRELPIVIAQSDDGRWQNVETEEGIVDAEVIDEPEAGQENAQRDRFRDARERLRDRARGFFGAPTHERVRDREQRRDREQARIHVDEPEMSERDLLLALRAQTNKAGEDYMASLRDSNLLVPGFSDEERGTKFNAMHRVYMQMMMQSCMRPLSRGVNTNSVVQAVGMLMAMRLLSKDFRDETDNLLQPLKDRIEDRIDAKTRSKGQQAESRALARNEKVGVDGRQVDRNTYLASKWRKRLDDLEHRERGSREMFTPESAALTEVALMESAFYRMRDGEHDADQIYKSYRAMRKHLHHQMSEDGLDRQEVVHRARIVIGQRMEAEPELGLMFNGVAHGRIVKSGPHAERIAGTDRVREVWTGEFEDHVGHKLPDDGMFTLRRPMDPSEHQVQLAEGMKVSMLDGLRRGDEAAYSQSLMGYLVGFAARREGRDATGLPETLQQRLAQSETMLASMDIDGLSDEAQREVYSNAFTDAMEEVGKAYPGVEQVLQRNFGSDWQATMQAAVNDPEGFYREQREQMQAHATSEQPNASGCFDWGFSARENEQSEYQPA